jgi:hypothetical protein
MSENLQKDLNSVGARLAGLIRSIRHARDIPD